MSKLTSAVLALIVGGGLLSAQDAFGTVRCGPGTLDSLRGKVIPHGPVAVLERQHREIGLSDEGATIISDTLTYIRWTICGAEYATLIDQRSVIRDVIQFPVHSRRYPGFIGECTIAGREDHNAVLALLDNPHPLPADLHYSPNDSTLMQSLAAWRIDETRMRFIPLRAEDVRCPPRGVFTVDGGA